ncbi:hypothetical protein SS50377_27670 [Spironucleus salmonicida]|uniref:Uncharacterized protein n=1 Tax=Spironucleus salmonicida TaxID=348837 RepID=V6M096_9EUKA|nr:hypothetical protein SS50377_27670 [Spironucleus salmonicida]|eukprot:EST46554.1 Hypothetical protein SS50377_13358 [Spironucleus salmonicida]
MKQLSWDEFGFHFQLYLQDGRLPVQTLNKLQTMLFLKLPIINDIIQEINDQPIEVMNDVIQNLKQFSAIFCRSNTLNIVNFSSFQPLILVQQVKKLTLVKPQTPLFNIQSLLFLEHLEIRTTHQFSLSELDFAGDFVQFLSIHTESLIFDVASFQCSKLVIQARTIFQQINSHICEILQITGTQIDIPYFCQFTDILVLRNCSILNASQLVLLQSLELESCNQVQNINFKYFKNLKSLKVSQFVGQLKIESNSLEQISLVNCRISCLNLVDGILINKLSYVNTQFGQIYQRNPLQLITNDDLQNINFLFSNIKSLNCQQYCVKGSNILDNQVISYLNYRYLDHIEMIQIEALDFIKTIKFYEKLNCSQLIFDK